MKFNTKSQEKTNKKLKGFDDYFCDFSLKMIGSKRKNE